MIYAKFVTFVLAMGVEEPAVHPEREAQVRQQKTAAQKDAAAHALRVCFNWAHQAYTPLPPSLIAPYAAFIS